MIGSGTEALAVPPEKHYESLGTRTQEREGKGPETWEPGPD